jgi:hypothetical protein
MANPDIPAALVVLQAHLVAADAALVAPSLNVARGIPAAQGQSIRYYWAGEIEPPRMGGNRVLNGELVGERFIIAALWPLTTLEDNNVTAIDIDMQTLAHQIRTRIQGDSTLGGNVTDLDLEYADPDTVYIGGARHVALRWDLDLSFIEYTLAP